MIIGNDEAIFPFIEKHNETKDDAQLGLDLLSLVSCIRCLSPTYVTVLSKC